MSKQNFEDKQAVLAAIDASEVRAPDFPVDIYLQESENLFVVAEEDQVALINAGLNWEVFGQNMVIRAGALRYSQSIWVKNRYSHDDIEREWEAKSEVAYGLKENLISGYRFAFRKRDDLLGRVTEISGGTGHADMIQDLSDLSELGRGFPEELAAINFDVTLLDIAATLSDEMAHLLARVNGQHSEQSESKNMRDRAYTHLREAVNEVKVTGKYVFRKDKDRVKAYSSQYKK